MHNYVYFNVSTLFGPFILLHFLETVEMTVISVGVTLGQVKLTLIVETGRRMSALKAFQKFLI